MSNFKPGGGFPLPTSMISALLSNFAFYVNTYKPTSISKEQINFLAWMLARGGSKGVIGAIAPPNLIDWIRSWCRKISYNTIMFKGSSRNICKLNKPVCEFNALRLVETTKFTLKFSAVIFMLSFFVSCFSFKNFLSFCKEEQLNRQFILKPKHHWKSAYEKGIRCTFWFQECAWNMFKHSSVRNLYRFWNDRQ